MDIVNQFSERGRARTRDAASPDQGKSPVVLHKVTGRLDVGRPREILLGIDVRRHAETEGETAPPAHRAARDRSKRIGRMCEPALPPAMRVALHARKQAEMPRAGMLGRRVSGIVL
ncbi:hypothetical protein TRIP_B250276 [uncultured Desulfatiglans sp.]|nr:hypothetical protein TRIP_B250276 [uncultured Desulfatiglans sp.]